MQGPGLEFARPGHVSSCPLLNVLDTVQMMFDVLAGYGLFLHFPFIKSFFPFLILSTLYPMEWLPRRRLIFLFLHKIIQLVWSTSTIDVQSLIILEQSNGPTRTLGLSSDSLLVVVDTRYQNFIIIDKPP